MQVTMFKGLLPVNLPDEWFSDPDQVRFANVGGAQAMDFRPNGGQCLKFWVEYGHGSQVSQHWEEVSNPDSIQWGDRPFAIEGRNTVALFGQSSSVLNLKHLSESASTT